MDKEEKIRKKAIWAIKEKMHISANDDIVESSIEFFDDRVSVSAKLNNGCDRMVVMKSKALAYKILSILSSKKLELE